jgi:hypothetical protein
MAKFQTSDNIKKVDAVPWQQWSVIKNAEKAAKYPERVEEFVIVELKGQGNRKCLFKDPFVLYSGNEHLYGNVQRVNCTHSEAARMVQGN